MHLTGSAEETVAAQWCICKGDAGNNHKLRGKLMRVVIHAVTSQHWFGHTHSFLLKH